MGKSERYIAKRKEQFADLINKKQSYKDAYVLAEKNKDLNILANFITESDDVANFINDMWTAFIPNRKQMFEFTSNLGIQELSSRYTPELGQKLQDLYSQRKINFLDVMQLVSMNDKEDIDPSMREKNAEQISYLLDVFTDPTMEVGIHRTGGSVSGEQVCNQGLNLTGDLSSGVRNDLSDRDIMSTLEKNVSFYQKNPGMSVAQIAVGGNYKNYGQFENVDIILVGVPKDKITETPDVSNYIHYDGEQPVLNTEYILGYVSVNTRKNIINEVYSDYTPQKDLEVEKALSQWKEGIQDVPQMSEYTSLKTKFFGFLNRILGKDKTRLDKATYNKDDDKLI